MIGMAAISMSCGTKSPASATNQLAFDSIVVDTTVSQTEGKDTPNCQLSLHLLYAKGPNDTAINDSIIRSGIFMADYWKHEGKSMAMQNAAEAFKQSYIKRYREECGQLLKEGFNGPACYYTYDVKSKLLENGKEGITTYIAQAYTYAGGAHGIGFTVVKNIDKKTGKIIQKSDIIKDGKEKAVDQLIVKQLLKQYRAKSLEALKDSGVFAFSDVYTPRNFILGKDSVTFIYQTDEIAPHALGEIRATVAYKDIEGSAK